MGSRSSDWMNRAARRKDLELTMYQTQTRQPSTKGKDIIHTPTSPPRRYVESIHTPSTSFSTNSGNDPSSPSDSIQSTSASSLGDIPECEDQLQLLLRKLRANTAEIEANESRMRELSAMDERVSTGISDRLKAVQGLNHRLNDLSRMLGRVEDLSRGN